jgi:outer membrane protein TolC
MRGAGAAVCALLAGCALGPNYQRPALGLPDAYRDAAPAPQAATPEPGSLGDRGWWEVYPDSDL